MIKKICKRCKEEKDIDDFNILKIDSSGYIKRTARCTKCVGIMNKFYSERKRRKEGVKKKTEYKDNSPEAEKRREYQRRYTKKKREKNKLKKSWSDELYEFIEHKNIFDIDDLARINLLIKRIEKLG